MLEKLKVVVDGMLKEDGVCHQHTDWLTRQGVKNSDNNPFNKQIIEYKERY